MSDLISKSALIKAFDPEHYFDWYTPSIIETINEAPTVDTVPVVHGNWDKYRLSKLFKLTCSVCHADVDEKTPFCPWCGAKMDGKKV